MPVSILRILNAINPHSELRVFQLIAGVIASLNGLANAIVYGFTKAVRKELTSGASVLSRADSSLLIIHQTEELSMQR